MNLTVSALTVSKYPRGGGPRTAKQVRVRRLEKAKARPARVQAQEPPPINWSLLARS
jgi:hypothetical protein